MANNELSSVTFRTNLNLMSIICFIAIIVAFVTSSTSANTAVNLQGGDKLTDEQLKVLLGNKRLIDEGMMPAVVYLDVNGNDEFNAGDAMYAEKRNDESGKRSDESNMPGVLRFGKRAQSFIRFGRAMKKDMPGVLRFGKRDMDVPGVLRFGKRSDMPGVLRFGKRDMPGVLRFGR